MNTLNIARLLGVILLGLAMASTTGCRGKKGDAARGHFANVSTADGAASGAAGSSSGAAGGLRGSSTEGTTGAPGEGAYPPGTMVDSETGGLTEMTLMEEFPAGVSVPELSTIYFDYDSDALTDSARAALDRNAGYLAEHKELMVVLRGHTDDAGTEEYNISLGSRRAQAVREHLALVGIAIERLNTVSFGKSMPADEGDDDATRAKNRRVEFFVYTE